MVYKLAGQTYLLSGISDEMEFNRLKPKQWMTMWNHFRKSSSHITYDYSELFFHPDLGIRPEHYPVLLEGFLVKYARKISAILARQSQLILKAD